MADPHTSRTGAASRRTIRRERLLYLLLALLVAAWPLHDALFRLDVVHSAVDLPATQLPWSGVLDLPADFRPGNGELSDQAKQFYPFYRWVSRSWRAGDPPTWNPLNYAGAPGIGNAQSGALDPQVLLLVALEALGGPAWFDWGLGFTAFARYALAFLGAALLARRLGLSRPAACLAGVTFAFSGYQVLWLNHALGHVPPFLPWVLLGLEGVRGPRPHRAMAGTALAMALAVLGGHAETAFYVGVAAGIWSVALLREDRRAGLRGLAALAAGSLVGAASLLPLTEYLQLSAAQVVRAAEAGHARLDAFALGLLVLVVGLGAGLRRWLPPARDPDAAEDLPSTAPTHPGDRAAGAPVAAGPAEDSPTTARLEASGGGAPRPGWLPAALGLSLAVAAAAFLLARRGLGLHALLALVPDRLGAPGTGGYRGEFNYIELASGWIAFVALALALAGALTGGRGFRRRSLVLGLGGVSFLLTLQTPGLLELYRFVPLVGLGATVRLAAVGSLMLALTAAYGLDRAGWGSRVAASLVLLPLVVAALLSPSLAPLDARVPRGPERDARIGVVLQPAGELSGENSRLEGWIDLDPRVNFGRVRVERVGADGHPLAPSEDLIVPLELHAAPSAAARAAGPSGAEVLASAPERARWFRTSFLLTSLLPDGHWRFTAEFLAEGQVMVSSRIGVSSVLRRIDRRPATLAFLGLGFLVLLCARGRWRWLAPALALLQAYDFQHGVNPTVPRAIVFPETATERYLARELGPYRFFADSAVLGANMNLVRGLRDLDGYDAMDPATFNEYRFFVLPDANPLLSWNARSVDLAHPAFRLFGVGLLVMREPFEHPDFELVAGPDEPEHAETWIYRARDPLPRAFCVARLLTHDQLGELARAAPGDFDPRTMAALKEDWRPARPFTRADVSEPVWTNATVRMQATLDGDGLLVLTDQHFPGWKVFVDGEERPLLRADLIFRGVALEAGEHAVEFRYEPASLRLGIALSLAGLLVMLGFVAADLRARRAPQSRG